MIIWEKGRHVKINLARPLVKDEVLISKTRTRPWKCGTASSMGATGKSARPWGTLRQKWVNLRLSKDAGPLSAEGGGPRSRNRLSAAGCLNQAAVTTQRNHSRHQHLPESIEPLAGRGTSGPFIIQRVFPISRISKDLALNQENQLKRMPTGCYWLGSGTTQ